MANKELPKFLVSERVLKDQWYFDQLTLLLRKSYGIKEQIAMYMDVVRLFNDKELELFNTLGKYDENTGLWLIDIDKINNLDNDVNEDNQNQNVSDILDKLGAIFGVQRRYLNINDGLGDEPLSNILMWCLIYANIIRNNYDGTYKTANDMYQKLNKISNGVIQITLVSDMSSPLTASFYLNSEALDKKKEGWDENQITYLQELFTQGYFDIKSSGIKYNKNIKSFSKMGFFDHMWNEGTSKGTVIAVPEDWKTNPPTYDKSKSDAEQANEACVYCTWDHAYWN